MRFVLILNYKHMRTAGLTVHLQVRGPISGKTDHVGVTIMDRLGQGHLPPLLEVPRLTCPSRESNPDLRVSGEHSSKDQFERPGSYLKHLHELTTHLNIYIYSIIINIYRNSDIKLSCSEEGSLKILKYTFFLCTRHPVNILMY
jgi:hypothetical protein